MRNWVSDSMSRSSAEITPIDSDCSSPNGQPIAATGSPTAQVVRLARARSGVSVEPLGIDLQQRDVGVQVGADDLRRDAVAVGELDVDVVGALELRAARPVTTCALVAT